MTGNVFIIRKIKDAFSHRKDKNNFNILFKLKNTLFTDIYILRYVKQTASGKLLYNTGSPAMLRDDADGWDGGGGREAPEEEDIYMTYSRCCMAQTITTF